ncbi:hypothetical protein GCM10011607_12770 [Shewanella inventionis]|uniref:Uncharacterized protein n=1 Tax=Shewanella inventionis TaxID=1738770 RepID=A0ABQ1IWJ2_9GAMM|nr:hypothetical protein [Shewanella inventionis]GGB53637.1 hypothetical protein GCM10011607_12770 [Shewanella inventionis]
MGSVNNELEVQAIEYSEDCKTAVVECPECNERHTHNASSWIINNDGIFSKTCWYGFTCKCERDVIFMLSFENQ